MKFQNKPRIQKIITPFTEQAGISLCIARVDVLHASASGNKLYKLKPILEYAKRHNIKQLISFGGAFSNHIHALALMSNDYQIPSLGIIRGEETSSQNPTLDDAQSAGMQLEFISRKEYQQRNDQAYLARLQKRYPEALIIPEGGSSQLAIQGCAQLMHDINQQHSSDVLTIACGTGATLAGMVCGLKSNQQALGYSVLKDQSLNQRVADFIQNEHACGGLYSIKQADFGGYAKLDKRLLAFILDFLDTMGVLLDPVYTSKMCCKLMQQIEAGEFSRGTRITMIHSGGLQGWRGMKKRVINLSDEQSWQKIEAHLSMKHT